MSPRWEAEMQLDLRGEAARPSWSAFPELCQLCLCCFLPLQLPWVCAEALTRSEEGSWLVIRAACGLWKAFCGRWFILTPMLAWLYVFPEMSQALYHVPIPFLGMTSTKLSQTKVSLVSREIWQGQAVISCRWEVDRAWLEQVCICVPVSGHTDGRE